MLKNIFSNNNEIRRINRKEKDNIIITEKAKQVELKIKNKKKLTTEDFIIMQGKDFLSD